MTETIHIRAISTRDVKVVQKALETIGFKTVKEGDAVDAYWVEMEIPVAYEYENMKFKVNLMKGEGTFEVEV